MTRKTGKNIWVGFYSEQIVKSATRPAGDFVPAIPKSRIVKGGYVAYDGATEWERAANKQMAKMVR